MNNPFDGSWEEFEACIRETIRSDFHWRLRPLDTRENREIVFSLIEDAMKKNSGVFPDEGNMFIEKTLGAL